jgi:hypothetical protein
MAHLQWLKKPISFPFGSVALPDAARWQPPQLTLSPITATQGAVHNGRLPLQDCQSTKFIQNRHFYKDSVCAFTEWIRC